jgi:EAL domain-containing protein (putative c-di-GMP-specific phosphodiesterase class I)
LSVNVSTHQINEEFCDVVKRILERTGFAGERLELEITESALIANAELAIRCCERWRELGVHIAVDDFGTGYSSLSYLSRLPVDRLKLDKSFVHRMIAEKKTAAIVRSVLALGKDLGVAVLVEGIETEAQFAMLEQMGCEQVQGFLLAKPVPANEARALLLMPWGARFAPVFRPERVLDRGLHAA